MDSETTTFLTTMRDSIEAKIDAGAAEQRASVLRVESTLSDLSREVGEQTMALSNHKAEDERQFSQIERDHQALLPSRLQKSIPGITGVTASAFVFAVVEWFKRTP